jgi:hypothetical protein
MEDVRVRLDLDDWEMVVHNLNHSARNLAELGGSGARRQAQQMERIADDITTDCRKVDPEFGEE